MQPEPPAELSSWKEIAAYLGVGVRTAQAWERQRGLPVRRLPGPRSTVLAAVTELDAWKNSANRPPETPNVPEAPAWRQPRWWWGGGLAIVMIAAAGGVAWWPRPGSAAAWRIEPYALSLIHI